MTDKRETANSERVLDLCGRCITMKNLLVGSKFCDRCLVVIGAEATDQNGRRTD